MAHSNNKVSSSIKEFEGSNTEEFEESGSEEFEGNDSEEFEESGSEEFKGNGSENFEGSSTEVSKACKFGKSGNTNIDNFILEKKLKWIPYDKFKNVEYLDKGRFGTIYKAWWLNGCREVVLKCHKNLSENLNEF
ncbi:hypothetical protein RhiirC2_785494 [Rhizophagus irregularis]|uniref:Protein kinase domain-containing protein n=1 Tax=Rhizophagus irregularis TaxID=588596 RepID=A0A2N1MWB6_9GLOM|nr:hypothetical protein RhiirC2_785494 [Rhizophagus irregularis]